MQQIPYCLRAVFSDHNSFSGLGGEHDEGASLSLPCATAFHINSAFPLGSLLILLGAKGPTGMS